MVRIPKILFKHVYNTVGMRVLRCGRLSYYNIYVNIYLYLYISRNYARARREDDDDDDEGERTNGSCIIIALYTRPAL